MGLQSVELHGGGRVRQAIAGAAQATGVDFGFLMSQARVESGLDPDARARTSSATGLYQFIDQSWLAVVDRHGGDHGLGWASAAIERGTNGRLSIADPALRRTVLELRRSPEAAAAMAAEHAADNRGVLEQRLGRAVAPVDLYLAHFLGVGGATTFLRGLDADPDQPAAALFPAAARANRAVFFEGNGPRSLADVRARFAAKFDGGTMPPERWAAAAPPNTAGQPETRTTSPEHARLAYLMLAALGV